MALKRASDLPAAATLTGTEIVAISQGGASVKALVSDIAGTVTGAVTSFNTRTGAVVATSGDYTSDQVTEGATNLYFTGARVGASLAAGTGISLSTVAGVTTITASGGGGSGTVTSVAMTVPTGLSVAGTPITASGTLAVTYAAGYQGFTSAESAKLAGIAAGAEVNVQADWSAASGDAQILNKPTIPGTTSDISEGSNLYFTAARVLAAVLTGLSTVSSVVITATDTVLSALGKLQAQISANVTSIAGKLAKASNLSDVASASTALSNLGGEPALGNPSVSGQVLASTTAGVRSWVANGSGGGSGTVTSVALTLPAWLSVSGSPVTTAGTLAVTAAGAQTANQFLATPNGAAGAVGLRALVAADVPTLNQSTTGNAATATALATARTINGVSFNGTANITVTAAATTLTGTSLNSTVVGSSLTAVGTLTTGAWNASPIAVAYGGTGANGLTGLVKANGTAAMTAATAGTDYVIPSGSITGNAATATALATARTIAGVSFDGTANIAIPFSGIASTPTTLAGYGITDAATKNIGAVAITGTTHTIAASDAGKDIQCNNAAAVTISIDKQATVPLDDGFTCLFSQVGAGAVTAAIVAASGVTLLVPNGAATTGVGDVRGLQHVSGDTWRVI